MFYCALTCQGPGTLQPPHNRSHEAEKVMFIVGQHARIRVFISLLIAAVSVSCAKKQHRKPEEADIKRFEPDQSSASFEEGGPEPEQNFVSVLIAVGCEKTSCMV